MPFNHSRRSFLKKTSVLSLGAVTLGAPSLCLSAAPWGELPAIAGSDNQYNILEIFCPGGMSQWENFWVSEDGNNGSKNWRGLEDFVSELSWSNCASSPSSSLETQYFSDFAGAGEAMPLHWGPATKPLWREDIFNRCRMVVTQHGENLHNFGGFRTFTGRPPGSPRAASQGSAVQRYHLAQPNPMNIPYSYVLAPKHLGRQYFMNQAALLGEHPGSARPLALKVGNALGDLLARPGISTEADALFNKLRYQYGDLLRWQGLGGRTRSLDFDMYDAAAQYLVDSDELDSILGGDSLTAGTASPCASSQGHNYSAAEDPTRRSIEVAAMLFANGAKHISLIDGGLNIGGLRDSSTPYDGHHRTGTKNVVEMTSVHLFNLLQSLADNIQSPDLGGAVIAGGGPSPKINLDTTLVLLRTEMGRTPVPGINTDGEFNSCGREHYPQATLAVLIGGPVQSRAIAGSILISGNNPNTAVVSNGFTPTDIHAAALLAAGVDPLASNNFTVGDGFSAQVNPGGNATAAEIYSNLKYKVLGTPNILDNIQWG